MSLVCGPVHRRSCPEVRISRSSHWRLTRPSNLLTQVTWSPCFGRGLVSPVSHSFIPCHKKHVSYHRVKAQIVLPCGADRLGGTLDSSSLASALRSEELVIRQQKTPRVPLMRFCPDTMALSSPSTPFCLVFSAGSLARADQLTLLSDSTQGWRFLVQCRTPNNSCSSTFRSPRRQLHLAQSWLQYRCLLWFSFLVLGWAEKFFEDIGTQLLYQQIVYL